MDADAGEFAVGVDLKLFQRIGRQQGRMGIKAVDHPLDGRLDHFLGIHLIHVVFLDEFDHIGKELQPFVGLLVVGRQISVKAVAQYQRSRHEHHGHPQLQVAGFSGCHIAFL